MMADLGLDPWTTLFWIRVLTGLAVIQQSIELLQIRAAYREEHDSPEGVWTWSALIEDFSVFPPFITKVFSALLKHPNFVAVLFTRLICGILLLVFPNPLIIFILLVSTLLIAMRWRGAFNGGSDSLTLILLTVLLLASSFPQVTMIIIGSLWYLTIQTLLSYTAAGIAKLRSHDWRSGRALNHFLSSPRFNAPLIFARFTRQRGRAVFACWIIIGFECLAPMALLTPLTCLIFLALAFGFHLVNALAFGLNRFLWTWLAAYPAVLYCSQFLF